MAKKSKVEIGTELEGSASAKSNKGVPARAKRKKADPKGKASKPGKRPPRSTSSTVHAKPPSDDEIRIRAYFIAERRMQLRLQGDSTHDWIEARRQLIEEATRRDS